MEVIRTLVQNLVIIIVLAVFLEMLLPMGQMRRYIKMVMGMLLIIVILQAAGDLARGDWHMDIPELLDKPAGGTSIDIMAKGNDIAAKNQLRAINNYKIGLARQIKALADMNGDLLVLDAEVDVYEESGDKRYGQIKEIRIRLDRQGAEKQTPDAVPVVDPIKITVNEGNAISSSPDEDPPEEVLPELKQRGDKLAGAITNFYNLSAEQVKIIY